MVKQIEEPVRHGGDPFDALPFASGKLVYVRKLYPLPRDLAADGVVIGTLRSPITSKDLLQLGGGGKFRLEHVPPGHRIPTETYDITIDGTPIPTELERAAVASEPARKEPSATDVRLQQVEQALLELRRGEASSPMFELVKILLAKESRSGFDPEFAERLFERGIAIGQKVHPASSGADDPSWPAVIRDFGREVLPEVLDRVQQIRYGVPPPPRARITPIAELREQEIQDAAVAATAAAGGVIPDPVRNAEQSARPPMLPQYVLDLVNELRRAIRTQDSPEWVAGHIERYVPEQAQALFRRGGPELDQLLVQLSPLLPELKQPEGVSFIEEVRQVLVANHAAELEDGIPEA